MRRGGVRGNGVRRPGGGGGGGGGLDSSRLAEDLAAFEKEEVARKERLPPTRHGRAKMAACGAWIAAVPYYLYTTPIFRPSLSWTRPRDLGQLAAVTLVGGGCLATAFRDLAEARARRIRDRRAQRALLRSSSSSSSSSSAPREEERRRADRTMLQCEKYAIVILNIVFLGMFLMMALYIIPKSPPPISNSSAISYGASVLVPTVLLRLFTVPIWRRLQPTSVKRRPRKQQQQRRQRQR